MNYSSTNLFAIEEKTYVMLLHQYVGPQVHLFAPTNCCWCTGDALITPKPRKTN